MNSTASALSLDPSESSDLQNVDFDKFGSIFKRNGYTALNTSAFNSSATFVGLHWYEKSDGTQKFIGVCGDKIARMDDLDGTWDDISAALVVTAGNNNHVSFRTFRDTWLATNGVDAPFKGTDTGDATAWTVVANADWAKYTEIYQGYVFIGNVSVSSTAHRSRVYWSNLGEIETWTATDFNDVSRDDGQKITGLRTLGEELIIFKDRSIYKALFTGDTDVPFIFRKTRSHVGCVAGHSIQEVNNGLVFRSQDGYYFFDGNNSFKLSDRINTTLDGYNANRYGNVASAYLSTKNRYYASESAGSATTHDRNVVWDSFNNAFSIHKGLAANVFTIVNTSGEERIYAGDYSGFVYRVDTGADDYPLNVQTAIDFYYYTKWFDYQDIVNVKTSPHIYIYFQLADSTLQFSYSYDFENSDTYSENVNISAGGDTYGSANYGDATYAASGGGVKRVDLASSGRTVRFKFANSTLTETAQVDGFGVLPHLETHV